MLKKFYTEVTALIGSITVIATTIYNTEKYI